MPTNAVRGFLDMIASLVGATGPTHLVACWDNDWRPAFRVEAIPSYKAHRVVEAGTRRSTARRCLTPSRSRCRSSSMRSRRSASLVGIDGHEADDVIGTLADRRGDAGRRRHR